MKIDVVLTPAEIDLLPQRDDLENATAIVFDVLRATSTILTALEHGAQEIFPVRTIDEALALKAQMPDALLGGERHGEKIDGFDLGNSPLEYRRELLRRIITTTTNGTVALRACESARGVREVLAGALLNMSALLEHLQNGACENVLLVCAGTFRETALEDVIAAGMICANLSQKMVELTDAAQIARAVFIENERDIFAALSRARNGRALLGKGRADDVRWCAQISFYNTIGVLKVGAIRRLTRAANGSEA